MKVIKNWIKAFFGSWLRRYKLIFGDMGVVLFFFGLPLAYPLIYTLIYNNELARDIPVVVVDNSRTEQSRELTRMYDASQYTKVVGYTYNLDEAKIKMKEREAYAILVIPEDFARKIGRMEQAVFPLYTDMSLLLRYRSVLFGTTQIQMQMGSDLRTQMISASPLAVGEQLLTSGQVEIESHFLGDESQGFASFIMIGVLVVILQQSLMLGIFMLSGGSRERRRSHGGVDPLAVEGPSSALILGRTLCYLTIYLPLMLYVLHYVPLMFSLPHVGSWMQYSLLMIPFLIASAFFAESLRGMVYERESSMLVWVFTSVLILFTTGLTWPRSAMNWFWELASSLVPATWAVDGFIAINSNNATISDISQQYTMLWVLAGAYFIIAVLVDKRMKLRAERRLLG